MDDLNAASLDDVKAWFSEYYGPSNAVLAVAGDVNSQDVLARGSAGSRGCFQSGSRG